MGRGDGCHGARARSHARPVLQVPLVCLRATIALARGDAVPAEKALAFTREALAPGVRPPVDPWLPLRLEAELRLAQGRVAEAAAVIERGLADADVRRSEWFTWPLLVIGARVAAAGAPGLLDGLRRRAAETPVTGPVLRALALTFAAEADRAAGTVTRARCDETVAAWEGVGTSTSSGTPSSGRPRRPLPRATGPPRPRKFAAPRRSPAGSAPARCGNRPNRSRAGPASPWP